MSPLGLGPVSYTHLHVLRGTPFLVQLYIFYFVLPSTGIELLHWESGTAAFVSLSVYTSCYVAEIVSGAIRAVPRGQTCLLYTSTPAPPSATRWTARIWSDR